MRIETWKFELCYWIVELFLIIGGALLVYNNYGSWLIWGIGTGVMFVGVGMMFLYGKLYTCTSMFKCDFFTIAKREDYYE